MKNIDKPTKLPSLIVEPARTWEIPSLNELYRYRTMILLLAWRDIMTHYRQSGFGMLWVFIKPFVQMIVFSVLFGKVAKMHSNNFPYPIFLFAAMVPWSFFSVCVSSSVHSLVSGGSLYSKISFPRLVMPLSSILVASVDFFVQSFILVCMMFYYDVFPTVQIVWLPLFLLLLLITAFGVGLFLGSINVSFRDVGQVLPLLLQALFFFSPVVYSERIIPEGWRYLYALNPMSEVINGFRWVLLDASSPPGATLWVAICSALTIFIVGLLLFQRMNISFVDYLSS
jgi:lipopolysaccharide transport system permease protein